MTLLFGRGRHDAQDWFDVSFLECGRDRNPRWCVKSSIDGIPESLDGFVKYKGPG